MNYKLFNVLAFATGAAIGSAVTWKFLKDKYERIAQEEIESVKEVFSRRREQEEKVVVNEDDEPRKFDEKPDIMELAAKVRELGYVRDQDENEEKEENDMRDKPYVISPEDYNDGDYNTESLTYYADDVLTDGYDMLLSEDEIEDMVGLDSLNHFGEYEDDSVFVRNDEREIDYEILRDERTYAEAHPHMV
jgi:hypothetical protein